MSKQKEGLSSLWMILFLKEQLIPQMTDPETKTVVWNQELEPVRWKLIQTSMVLEYMHTKYTGFVF